VVAAAVDINNIDVEPPESLVPKYPLRPPSASNFYTSPTCVMGTLHLTIHYTSSGDYFLFERVHGKEFVFFCLLLFIRAHPRSKVSVGTWDNTTCSRDRNEGISNKLFLFGLLHFLSDEENFPPDKENFSPVYCTKSW
jgi:hypothetical protein